MTLNQQEDKSDESSEDNPRPNQSTNGQVSSASCTPSELLLSFDDSKRVLASSGEAESNENVSSGAQCNLGDKDANESERNLPNDAECTVGQRETSSVANSGDRCTISLHSVRESRMRFPERSAENTLHLGRDGESVQKPPIGVVEHAVDDLECDIGLQNIASKSSSPDVEVDLQSDMHAKAAPRILYEQLVCRSSQKVQLRQTNVNGRSSREEFGESLIPIETGSLDMRGLKQVHPANEFEISASASTGDCIPNAKQQPAIDEPNRRQELHISKAENTLQSKIGECVDYCQHPHDEYSRICSHYEHACNDSHECQHMQGSSFNEGACEANLESIDEPGLQHVPCCKNHPDYDSSFYAAHDITRYHDEYFHDHAHVDVGEHPPCECGGNPHQHYIADDAFYQTHHHFHSHICIRPKDSPESHADSCESRDHDQAHAFACQHCNFSENMSGNDCSAIGKMSTCPHGMVDPSLQISRDLSSSVDGSMQVCFDSAPDSQPSRESVKIEPSCGPDIAKPSSEQNVLPRALQKRKICTDENCAHDISTCAHSDSKILPAGKSSQMTCGMDPSRHTFPSTESSGTITASASHACSPATQAENLQGLGSDRARSKRDMRDSLRSSGDNFAAEAEPTMDLSVGTSKQPEEDPSSTCGVLQQKAVPTGLLQAREHANHLSSREPDLTRSRHTPSRNETSSHDGCQVNSLLGNADGGKINETDVLLGTSVSRSGVSLCKSGCSAPQNEYANLSSFRSVSIRKRGESISLARKAAAGAKRKREEALERERQRIFRDPNLVFESYATGATRALLHSSLENMPNAEVVGDGSPNYQAGQRLCGQVDSKQSGAFHDTLLSRSGERCSVNGVFAESASTRANVSQTKEKRAQRVKWRPEEIVALHKGVEKHGAGRWAVILREFAADFDPVRISVDLKDKWRNLAKTPKQSSRGHCEADVVTFANNTRTDIPHAECCEISSGACSKTVMVDTAQSVNGEGQVFRLENDPTCSVLKALASAKNSEAKDCFSRDAVEGVAERSDERQRTNVCVAGEHDAFSGSASSACNVEETQYTSDSNPTDCSREDISASNAECSSMVDVAPETQTSKDSGTKENESCDMHHVQDIANSTCEKVSSADNKYRRFESLCGTDDQKVSGFSQNTDGSRFTSRNCSNVEICSTQSDARRDLLPEFGSNAGHPHVSCVDSNFPNCSRQNLCSPVPNSTLSTSTLDKLSSKRCMTVAAVESGSVVQTDSVQTSTLPARSIHLRRMRIGGAGSGTCEGPGSNVREQRHARNDPVLQVADVGKKNGNICHEMKSSDEGKVRKHKIQDRITETLAH